MDREMTIDPGSSPKGQGLLMIIGGYTINGIYTYYQDTVQIYTVDKGHVKWNTCSLSLGLCRCCY